MGYLLGVDVGTSGAKAVLIDFEGRLLAEAAHSHATGLSGGTDVWSRANVPSLLSLEKFGSRPLLIRFSRTLGSNPSKPSTMTRLKFTSFTSLQGQLSRPHTFTDGNTTHLRKTHPDVWRASWPHLYI